jgi:hypothetical protein
MTSCKVWRITGSAQPKHLWLLAAFGAAVIAAAGGNWSYASDDSAQESTDSQVSANSEIDTEDADIVVYKAATCGCCHLWVAHLREHGLKVAVKNVETTQTIRSELGIPPALESCHTGVADGYWIEGHVPADLVQRLLKEQSEEIRGIAVPGMEIGSPGMEGPNPVTTYDVVAYDKDGEVSVYATRKGKTASP